MQKYLLPILLLLTFLCVPPNVSWSGEVRESIFNTYDASNEGSVEVTSDLTAFTLVAANANRTAISISLLNDKSTIIRMRTAASDNDLTGIILSERSPTWNSWGIHIYRGEISIIAESKDGVITFSELEVE